jgi:isopenicillin N synthase-like dioxygenase
MDALARRFFALPLKDRLAIENVHSPQFRGYTRAGTEHTGGTADWREQIDIGPERTAVEPGPRGAGLAAADRAEPVAGRPARAARGRPALAGRGAAGLP